jgi:hypothetical protein
MLPDRVPPPRDDQTARAHLRANVQAALWHEDPGHWHVHHIALPGDMPGDFTPVRTPEYAEEEHAVHEPLLEYLAGLFGIDHAQGIQRRGLDADREPGQ